MKETLFRLRVVRATGYLGPEFDPVLQETVELKLIMATLIRKAAAKRKGTGKPKA